MEPAETRYCANCGHSEWAHSADGTECYLGGDDSLNCKCPGFRPEVTTHDTTETECSG